MALSIIHKPSNYGRVFDENSLYYEIESTSYMEPNFSFLITLYKWEGITLEQISQHKLYPQTDGVLWFNPSTIFATELSPSCQKYDFDPSITGVTEATNSAKAFRILITEKYGTPPATQDNYYNDIILYNGCQQFISYDSTLGGGNTQWVMSGGTIGATGYGTGHYLTDASQIYLDENDYYNLYFINPIDSRITSIMYTFYYSTGITAKVTGNEGTSVNGIDGPEMSSQSTIKGDLNNITPMKGEVQPGGNPSYVGDIQTLIIYETGLTMGSGGLMFYVPIGMKTLKKKYPWIPASWLYYKVDLLKSGQSQVLNRTSFIVNRTCRDSRYIPYKVAWLNRHGGYDYFVFDKGAVIKEKEKRDTFTQNLQPGYSFNQSGTLVYNMNPDQTITLTTSLLETQSQSQILVGLFHSFQVFMIWTYIINNIEYPVAVPYIVEDNEMIYQQIITDQTFPVSITLTPGNKIKTQKS